MLQGKLAPQNIADGRLIAGYLRDAIFHKRVFELTIDGQPHPAHLDSITEKSARDKSDRILRFKFLRRSSSELEYSLKADTPIAVRLPLDRLVIQFTSVAIESDSGFIHLKLPSEAVAATSRETHRFEAGHLTLQSGLVVLTGADGLQKFASFQLTDISRDGLGGILYLPSALIPTRPVRIEGKLIQDSGAIIVDGEIHRVLPHAADRATTTIGIRNRVPQDPLASGGTQIFKNRRQLERVQTAFPVEVTSPLYPETPAYLQTEDISLTGIRARLFNLADVNLFRRGLEVRLKSPQLRLEVISVTGKHVTFRILRSALEEHIKLFNLQSLLCGPDLATGTPIASDLSQVYTTSGSMSTQMARGLSSNANYLMRSAGRTDGDKSVWYLRWLQQAQDGRIRAAILAAPIADHVWYMGAFAGHMDAELRISRDFASRFFTSLRDFLLSLGRKEYILFNWLKTHPCWVEWDTDLKKRIDDAYTCRFEGDIVYLQDRTEIRASARPDFAWRRIAKGDVAAITQAMDSILHRPLKTVFNALGLNPYTTGAPSTSELLLRTGHDFKRDFFEANLEDCRILLMLSHFPANVFLNGVINYPFVHTSRALSTAEIEELTARILELCARNGVDCLAYFLTSEGECQNGITSTLLKCAPIVWTLGPAELLDFWQEEQQAA